MTTTLTVLVLLIAIALFVVGGSIFTLSGKKVSAGQSVAQKLISAVGVVLIAGVACQLWTPVYLTSVNPAILEEMIPAMQKQKEEQQSKQVRKYVKEHIDEMIVTAPVSGNVEAQKTIFLWSDYSCPYCRRVHAEIARVLAERDDVRLVLKNYSIHGALSDAPAKAVIAAKIQDNAKAAKLDELLMAKEYYGPEDIKLMRSPEQKDQEKLAKNIEASVLKLAKEAGLDTKKLAEDMKGDIVRQEMRNTYELARRFEISGTPYLIITDGKKVGVHPGFIPYAKITEDLGPAPEAK